jgi:hypothetical protein
MEGEGAHIRLKLDTSEPIALGDFVAMFVGVGNQFEKFIAKEYPDLKAGSEFFIKEVRAGCIEADLVAWVMGGGGLAALGVKAIDLIDKGQILGKFVSGFGKRLGSYFKPGGRAENVSTGDLNDFLKATIAIAKDENASANLEAAVFEDGERKIKAGFKFTTDDAREAEREIAEHKQELEAQSDADHKRVMMRFVRPSIEKVSSHKRTGERALIEAIHPKPLAVLYASDMARERIQHELRSPYPFNLLFDVDVNVEISRGRPVAYRIKAVHDVTDAPESDDDLEA